MFIEKVQTYEGANNLVKALEEELDEYRKHLRRIRVCGLTGMGAPTLRFALAEKICGVKQELLTLGAYRSARFTEMWGLGGD